MSEGESSISNLQRAIGNGQGSARLMAIVKLIAN